MPIGISAFIIPAIIGAGAGVAGAAISSHQAGKAVDATTAAADRAAELQSQTAANYLDFARRQYEQGRTDMKPWLQLGTGAVKQLSSLTGIPMDAGAGGPASTSMSNVYTGMGQGQARPLTPQADPYPGATLNEWGYYVLPDGNLAPNQVTPGMLGYTPVNADGSSNGRPGSPNLPPGVMSNNQTPMSGVGYGRGSVPPPQRGPSDQAGSSQYRDPTMAQRIRIQWPDGSTGTIDSAYIDEYTRLGAKPING